MGEMIRGGVMFPGTDRILYLLYFKKKYFSENFFHSIAQSYNKKGKLFTVRVLILKRLGNIYLRSLMSYSRYRSME